MGLNRALSLDLGRRERPRVDTKAAWIAGTFISVYYYKRGISPMADWTLARVFPINIFKG